MVKIKKELLMAVIQYLSKKPYCEVFQILDLLSRAEEVKEEPKE